MKVKVKEVGESYETCCVEVAMGLICAQKEISFCHHESESLNFEVL